MQVLVNLITVKLSLLIKAIIEIMESISIRGSSPSVYPADGSDASRHAAWIHSVSTLGRDKGRVVKLPALQNGWLPGRIFFSLDNLPAVEGDEFPSIRRDGTGLLTPVSPRPSYPLSCLSGVADRLCIISGTTTRTAWKSSTLGSNSQWKHSWANILYSCRASFTVVIYSFTHLILIE